MLLLPLRLLGVRLIVFVAGVERFVLVRVTEVGQTLLVFVVIGDFVLALLVVIIRVLILRALILSLDLLPLLVYLRVSHEHVVFVHVLVLLKIKRRLLMLLLHVNSWVVVRMERTAILSLLLLKVKWMLDIHSAVLITAIAVRHSDLLWNVSVAALIEPGLLHIPKLFEHVVLGGRVAEVLHLVIMLKLHVLVNFLIEVVQVLLHD